MKKFLFGAIALVAGCTFVSNVSAAPVTWENQPQDAKYALVGNITNDDSLKTPGSVRVTYSGEKTNNVTVTYSAADLKEVEGDNTRPAGYAWLGLRFTVPTDTAKYSLNDAGDTLLSGNDSYNATGHYIDEYVGVDFAKLKAAVEAGKDVTYTLTYTWKKADDEAISTQTFTINIVPEGITLENIKGENVWNTEIAEQIKAEANKEATKDDNALDNVPKTGSSLPIALIGLLGLATLTGAYSLKLAYNRK